MENEFKIAKGCRIGDTIVLEDGTEIDIQRRAKAMQTSATRLTVVIKRDTPIGKIRVIKQRRKDGE